jgi:4-hydroxy-3-polyprenylbenzoate decarboxylase
MAYEDLSEFLKKLEDANQLIRIKAPVDPNLEITEILNRLLANDGPAVIFENVIGYNMPVVANLFGSLKRVTMGLSTDLEGLDKIGEFLAQASRPKPPQGIAEAIKQIPHYRKLLSINPKTVSSAPCQEVVIEGEDVDLGKFPILYCWPGDAGPLITWPLVVTNPPEKGPANVGVYRMQVINKNQTIIRWLDHRGGAIHYKKFKKLGKPMPVSVAIGNEPSMLIAATTPVPDDLSEYDFAGLIREKPVKLVKCKTNDLLVPATSEIVLEGEVYPDELATEGPFADHTGYYNSAEQYPVFHIKCITHKRNPLYLATVTGRPPREDAVLPLLRQAFSEIVDFSLPMEAVSYRMAVVSIKKNFPGQAKQIIMGLFGYFKQFMGLKYIIAVDPDIDVNNWPDIIWALATRVDPDRDSFIIKEAPIDELDFASLRPGIGSKMGIDATTKAAPEVQTQWLDKITMDPKIVEQVNNRLKELGLDSRN